MKVLEESEFDHFDYGIVRYQYKEPKKIQGEDKYVPKLRNRGVELKSSKMLEIKEQENKQIQDQLKSKHKEDIWTLQFELKSKNVLVERQQKLIEKLEDQRAKKEVMEEMEGLKNKIQELNDWNDDLINENNKLKEQVKTLTKKNEDQNGQIENLHGEVDRLDSKIEDINQEFDKTEEGYQEQIRVLE